MGFGSSPILAMQVGQLLQWKASRNFEAQFLKVLDIANVKPLMDVCVFSVIAH